MPSKNLETVENAFNNYLNLVYGQTTLLPSDQFRQVKIAFYGGVVSLFTLLKEINATSLSEYHFTEMAYRLESETLNELHKLKQ